MANDILWTTMTTFVVMAAMVLVNALLSRRGVEDPFGTLNLAKRVAGVVVPVVMLGTSVGLVKMIAGTHDEIERARLRLSGDAIVVALLGMFAAVVLINPRWIAVVLGLGSASLLWATWAYSAAMALNGLSYAFARAVRNQSRANWLNIVANAALPLAAIWIAPNGAGGAWILGLMSVPVILMHGIELAAIAAKDARALRGKTPALASTSRRLLNYSLPRCVTALASAGMFAVGPLVAARGGSAADASALLAGLVLVQATSAALQAAGVVTLPHASALVPERSQKELRDLTRRLVVAGLAVAALGVPAIMLGTEDLLATWLGPELASSAWLARIVLMAVPAIVLHTLLRSILDATVEVPWNTIAAIAGLIATILLSAPWRRGTAEQLAVAFAVGAWIQGGVTMLVVRRHFGVALGVRTAVALAATATSVGLIGLAIALVVPAALVRLLLLASTVALLGLSVLWPRSPLARMVWLEKASLHE